MTGPPTTRLPVPDATTQPGPAGRAAAALFTPLFAGLAVLRRGRPLHPEGICCTGASISSEVPALSGPVLVRLSEGLWRGPGAKPDALGIAVRFGGSTGAPAPGELDLLFATFSSVWTLPLAPLTTNTRDFLANTYWAVVPFEIEGLGRCHLRLRPERAAEGEGNRVERLRRALAEGRAEWVIQAKVGLGWRTIGRIRLEEELPGDLDRLRFEPHRAGRGVRPVGFLTEVRSVVYPKVQATRLQR